MKKLTTLLAFFFMSFPLFYIDGSNANHSDFVYFSENEVRNEIQQIRSYQIDAPEFSNDLDWFNTNERIYLSEFRDKIVVINFWTFGNNKSMQLHKELKTLKSKYQDEVVFIDVQSPFFYHNLDRKNIQDAIKKYDIKNPVVFDRNNHIRQAFNVHYFPTYIILDKQGKYAGYLSGLDKTRILGTYIDNLLSYSH